MKVRVAVAPGAGPFDAEALVHFGRTAERVGFDGVWLSDVPLGPGGDPLLSLAHLAALTDRLHLGVNVVPIGRGPLVLARQLAQLDQLCRGRLLLTFVPGLGQPGERQALGFPTGDRGALVEEVLAVLRRWWAGDAVEHHSDHFDWPATTVEPRPVQQPLEVWLGGRGPKALDRVARCGDGWLTAAVGPDEAGRGRQRILRRGVELGRTIDPEHFGISIPYARTSIPVEAAAALRARRPDRDPEQDPAHDVDQGPGRSGRTDGSDLADICPVGAGALRDLLGRHVEVGLSKFVLRPVDPTSIDDDLAWLADAVGDLQT